MMENNPNNGIAERIEYLQAIRFDPDVVDETFITGSLAKEAVSAENKGSERISALKVLADIKRLTGVQGADNEPERMTAEERRAMLDKLLWHASEEAKTVQNKAGTDEPRSTVVIDADVESK